MARADTVWDADVAEDDPDRQIVLLAGHYGHVVDHCDQSTCHDRSPSLPIVHVEWEGAIDNRRLPTIWTNDTPWHMLPEEIEHID